MATASFKSTKYPGIELPNDPVAARHGVAIVTVDDGEGKSIDVEINYWPSLISQWGKEGVKSYVEAEALHRCGFIEDARNHAIKNITAKVMAYDEKGEPSETDQTHGQKWASEHPDLAEGLD